MRGGEGNGRKPSGSHLKNTHTVDLDSEEIDMSDRTIRGKKGIDKLGMWQDEKGTFHYKALNAKQMERIMSKLEAGDEIYVDEEGNIEPDVDTNFVFDNGNDDLNEEEDNEDEEIEEDKDEENEQMQGQQSQLQVQNAVLVNPTPAELAAMDLEHKKAHEEAVAKAIRMRQRGGDNVGNSQPNVHQDPYNNNGTQATHNQGNGEQQGRVENVRGGEIISGRSNGNSNTNPNPVQQNNGSQRGITWSQAATGMKYQTENPPEYKYSMRHRVEISFPLNGILSRDSTEDQQAVALKEVFKAILGRIKFVVHKGAIMPWKTGAKYKAIERTKDIPERMSQMRKYIRREDEKEGRLFRKAFKSGRNTKWRLNLNFGKAEGDEFIHLWNESKKHTYTMTAPTTLQEQLNLVPDSLQWAIKDIQLPADNGSAIAEAIQTSHGKCMSDGSLNEDFGTSAFVRVASNHWPQEFWRRTAINTLEDITQTTLPPKRR